MTTATFYIGANNATGKVDVDLALEVLDEHYPGYAYWEALGRWQGSAEASLVVQVAGTDEELARTVAKQLTLVLHQDAVALRLTEDEFELITN